jgi:uncharacterized protein YifN (PemK superfamily)
VPIDFHPGYGIVLYCDFSHQAVPEMVKSRPVVVLSRKNANLKLCTVVPLSGTEPDPVQPWHHRMDFSSPTIPACLKGNDWWAKCDCLATVSFARLDRIRAGKCPNTGKRLFASPRVCTRDEIGIKMGIVSHLGMSDLISKVP